MLRSIMLMAVAVVVVGLALIRPTTSATAPRDAGVADRGGRHLVPTPPWPAGDEIGMGNTQGYGTRRRCLVPLVDPRSRMYELAHVRSNAMPRSPFGEPEIHTYDPTAGLPFTRHAGNGNSVSGAPGAQGTQMDALGHFGVLPEAWNPNQPLPVEDITYYGGFTQGEVKPTPESPLLHLGIEKAPPILTSAVLLDAQRYLGAGTPLAAGTTISADDIETMLSAQGLSKRGLLPGDVVLIRTGWGDRWNDSEQSDSYYTAGPGLSYDAAQYLAERAVVLVALDNPFTDAVKPGQLTGDTAAPPENPAGLPFAVHHSNLVEHGIYQIQNANLTALANDKVWLSCTVVLPLPIEGGAGSPVRPIAIGVPGRHR